MVHELKCWPVYFQAVRNGSKPFEVRKADRNFCVGDAIRLREYDPVSQNYTGCSILCQITFVLRDTEFEGVTTGFCVLGLAL